MAIFGGGQGRAIEAAAAQQAEDSDATQKAKKSKLAKSILDITNAKLKKGSTRKQKGTQIINLSLPSPSQKAFAPFFSNYLESQAFTKKKKSLY